MSKIDVIQVLGHENRIVRFRGKGYVRIGRKIYSHEDFEKDGEYDVILKDNKIYEIMDYVSYVLGIVKDGKFYQCDNEGNIYRRNDNNELMEEDFVIPPDMEEDRVVGVYVGDDGYNPYPIKVWTYYDENIWRLSY